jgi:hypothetical protein
VAGLAALTRPIGVVLYACLLFYLWQTRRLRSLARLFAAHAPLLSFGAYALLAGLHTGDLLAYFTTNHRVWQRAVAAAPWQTFAIYFSGEPVTLWGWRLSWMDFGFTILYLALAVLVFRQDRLLGLFALGAVLIPIFSGNLLGMPRYGMIVFPFYLLIARWVDMPWKLLVVYSVSTILMVLFTVRFVLWHWLA